MGGGWIAVQYRGCTGFFIDFFLLGGGWWVVGRGRRPTKTVGTVALYCGAFNLKSGSCTYLSNLN